MYKTTKKINLEVSIFREEMKKAIKKKLVKIEPRRSSSDSIDLDY
jgi:hypothetical protein